MTASHKTPEEATHQPTTEPIAGPSTPVNRAVPVGRGRKPRGPPPSREQIKAGLLAVDQQNIKKIRQMKKSLLVEICRCKFGGNTEAYEILTAEAIIIKLVC